MLNMIRPFRVYTRNLHSTTNVLDIQASLSDKDHDVIQVTNSINPSQNPNRHFFCVNLKKPDHNESFKLEVFLYTKIKI